MNEKQLVTKESERKYLENNSNHYFFDINFMILSDNSELLEKDFGLNLSINDLKEYVNQRNILITKMLLYQQGLDILIKLLYRSSPLQIQGYYYFQAVDEFNLLLNQIHHRLIQFAIAGSTNQNIPLISKRIVRLFAVLNVRKNKEIQYNQLQGNKTAQQDQSQAKRFLLENESLNLFITNLMVYQKNHQEILKINKNTQIYKMLQLNTIPNDINIQNLLQFISTFTTYQQQLLLFTLKQEKNDQSIKLNTQFINLYNALYIIDNGMCQSIQLWELLNTYFGELECWKIFVIEKLMQQEQYQLAYDILLSSKIQWSTIDNCDLIILLLIKTGRQLQAYFYATQINKLMKDEIVFKYFIQMMIQEKQLKILFQFELDPSEQIILDNIIQNTNNVEIQILYIENQLQRGQHHKAIKSYLQIKEFLKDQKLEQKIKQEIKRLSKIEEEYYHNMLNESVSENVEESKMMDLILTHKSKSRKIADDIFYFIKQTDTVILPSDNSVLDYYGCQRIRLF